MGLCTPETGWIAAKLMPAGATIGLSLLGVAVALNQGQASDEEINDWYEAFATDSDPVYLLNHFYVELEQQYPFLLGHLGALTGWTEAPDIQSSQVAVDATEHLKTIRWSETEPRAGGDILGRVKNQMDSIGHRRTKVFHYGSIADAMLGIVERGHGLEQQRSFVDAWCGSGCRVIGMAQVQRMLGHDTTKTAWRLNDPAPTAVAMAGLNMVAYDIGPDVKLMCDREWSEIWSASSLWSVTPALLASLPPELAIDAPALSRKRLGR